MGLSFRRSIKVAPGIKLNFSKSGVSTSFGGRGFTYNTRGRVTASIPGTGIRYTTSTGGRPSGRTRLPAALVSSATPTPGKRAQANEDFLATLSSRMLRATQDYFFSWGVCVSRDDFEDAAALPEHAPVFEAVSQQMDVIATACRLLADIGSLSLTEKEKAMRALYAVESHLQASAGQVTALAPALANLQHQISVMPIRPNSEKYIGITLVLIVLSIWWLPFLIVAAIAAVFGGLQRRSFVKARNASVNRLEAADAEIDQVMQQEITLRDKTVLE